MDGLLAEFHVYRRWRGGHWERWTIDREEWGYAPMWFRVSRCGEKPAGAVGVPLCEEW